MKKLSGEKLIKILSESVEDDIYDDFFLAMKKGRGSRFKTEEILRSYDFNYVGDLNKVVDLLCQAHDVYYDNYDEDLTEYEIHNLVNSIIKVAVSEYGKF